VSKDTPTTMGAHTLMATLRSPCTPHPSPDGTIRGVRCRLCVALQLWLPVQGKPSNPPPPATKEQCKHLPSDPPSCPGAPATPPPENGVAVVGLP
jgi:hypothetical protein